MPPLLYLWQKGTVGKTIFAPIPYIYPKTNSQYNMRRRQLIIFSKNPVAGKVKTRLAADIGDEKALAVYHQLLQLTAEVAATVNAEAIACYSDRLEEGDIFGKLGFEKAVQKGADLGERMCNAFENSFREGFRHVVLIGSDCPELDRGIIEAALDHLQTYDMVIGPATDGGYYLIGLTANYRDLFIGREWSHQNVFAQTMETAKALGLSFFELPELSDVDNLSDLEAVREKGILN